MSKVAKIVLGVTGGAILIAYSLVRLGGDEIGIIYLPSSEDGREWSCHRGVCAISALTSPTGCVMYDGNGVEIGYTALSQPPGAGCSGTPQQQFECAVDNCLAGQPMPNPVEQEQLDKVQDFIMQNNISAESSVR